MNVQLVQQGITVLAPSATIQPCILRQTYLGDGCRENNHFVQFAHSLHELVDARSLDHVDIVVLALDFDRNGEIRALQNLQSTVSPIVFKVAKCAKNTLKLLWTSVSSRSSTKHFRPCR